MLFPLPRTTEGPLKQALNHPKNPDFIDATTPGFNYDSIAGLDDLQYPYTEAFVMRTLHSLSPFLRSA